MVEGATHSDSRQLHKFTLPPKCRRLAAPQCFGGIISPARNATGSFSTATGQL